jgi:hypothetical protein
MLVPDLDHLNLKFNANLLLSSSPKAYFDEIKEENKKDLDCEVAKQLGFDEPENVVENLHKEYVKVVEDRLIKAGRPLKSREIENEQDN